MKSFSRVIRENVSFFRQLAKFPFLFVNDGKMGKAKERMKDKKTQLEREREKEKDGKV